MKIVTCMGVSGAGKTTFAQGLAQRLGWHFLECDDLHPPANVAKMQAGQPLTDADRAPWLESVADRMRQLSCSDRGAVVACSALKGAYRDRLKQSCDDWLLIYLKAEREALRRRLTARTGHFMPPSLLDSQFAALEEPRPEEHALVLDAFASLDDNVGIALAALRGR